MDKNTVAPPSRQLQGEIAGTQRRCLHCGIPIWSPKRIYCSKRHKELDRTPRRKREHEATINTLRDLAVAALRVCNKEGR